jgi:hypothetical protein
MSLKTGVVRVLLKILWSVGGHRDDIDGLPRLRGPAMAPLVARARPGDAVLLGNNGVLTHVAVYAGEGEIVHAMATEKTMRGWFGALIDAVRRWFGRAETHVGVLRERLDGFVDRYERDTWVLTRFPGLSDDQVARGLDRVRGLVGQPYDYGFRDANEAWYCTELVDAFARAADPEHPPVWVRKAVQVPLLLDEQVIEPVALLEAGATRPVAANRAALGNYRDKLGDAEIVDAS